MPPHSRRSSDAGAPERKSVLFCPTCGHESPVDGDWQVQARERGLVYACPACDEVVTVRPDRTATESSVSSSSHDSPAGDSFVAQSVRLAFSWAAWPYKSAECTLNWAVTPTAADDTSAPADDASAATSTLAA